MRETNLQNKYSVKRLCVFVMKCIKTYVKLLPDGKQR